TSLRDLGFFHAEFHRENPFGGWGHEIRVNSNEADIANKERVAWENNYVILETKGKGQYIGCNISITNFQGSWWGEGDDMIWVDGYKWPPDLHGTGSEDYLNQAWGMQPNAFLRNGSSIFEGDTGGYQTSYVFHLENPVRFTEELKVTIEHGHGNHLRNEVSSVAYWYESKPSRVRSPPPVAQRMPVSKDGMQWVQDSTKQITSKEIHVNEEMKKMKRRWKGKDFPEYISVVGPITKDDEGFLCINMPFSSEPGAPIHEIPVVELLEFFIYKHITLHVKVGAMDEIRVGTFEMSSSGNLLFKPEGEKDLLELKEILETTVGSKVEIEALIDIDEMQPAGDKPTSFVVYIQHVADTG
ncbi:DUF2961 domain-containing protein, partial [Candidatus Bathyarchaeota archaeon]|nr:DUF2961 domain-containing protein [Candidatus Bathyarchaeota archaeon]